MIYCIYATLILFSILVYQFNNIYIKLKLLYFKGKKAIKNPRVARDVALAVMVNSLFSLVNAMSPLSVFGYLILTLAGTVGIIVSNDKIDD
jgi:hypothetical protein